VFAESDSEKYGRIYNQKHVGDMSSTSAQLTMYESYGYSSDNWRTIEPDRPLFGYWCTDFLAYDMRHRDVISPILSVWYQQEAEFTTPSQRNYDAISFSFILQTVLLSKHLDVSIASLPSNNITGSFRMNSLFQNSVDRVWKFD
jgi:hypothetical protein